MRYAGKAAFHWRGLFAGFQLTPTSDPKHGLRLGHYPLWSAKWEKTMSDPDDTKNSAVDSLQEVDIAGGTDWFLQNTIESVIGLGVEMGVTLSVGGSVISGILISGKTYFDELADTVAAASKSSDDISSVLGKAWRQYKAIYEKPDDAPKDWSGPPAAYIHLRNAKFYAPGQPPIPSDKGLLWRGKLIAVDGFSVGNFSVS